MSTGKLGKSKLRMQAPPSLEGVVLRALGTANMVREPDWGDGGDASRLSQSSRALLKELDRSGLLHAETVRLSEASSSDQRFVVEYAADPDDAQAILLRIRPASVRAPRSAPERMLTTQQAADLLSVSRPYVVDLADRGVLKGVLRTQSGHRRIPEKEVLRLRGEMQVTRRRALDEINELTAALREREHNALLAKSRSKRRGKR